MALLRQRFGGCAEIVQVDLLQLEQLDPLAETAGVAFLPPALVTVRF